MAYPVRITTFADAAVLTAAQLNDEYDLLYDALDGSSTSIALKNTYASSDVPNLRLNNTGGGVVQDWQVSGATKAKVNAAGQFESALATGTAPLLVDSTTKVANLNVDQVDGLHGFKFAQTYEFGGCLAFAAGKNGGAFRIPALPSGASSFTISWGGILVDAGAGVGANILVGVSVYDSSNSWAEGEDFDSSTVTGASAYSKTVGTSWAAIWAQEYVDALGVGGFSAAAGDIVVPWIDGTIATPTAGLVTWHATLTFS